MERVAWYKTNFNFRDVPNFLLYHHVSANFYVAEKKEAWIRIFDNTAQFLFNIEV